MISYERRPELPPFFTESISELALRKRMYECKGVPFLLLPDLDFVMRTSTLAFETEVQEVFIGDKKPEDMRKYIYFIEGIPGSGKTYTANHLVLRYLRRASERMSKKYGVDVQVRYLQWDNVEDALIEEGVINPVRGQPFSPGELRTVGSFLKLLTSYSLRDDPRIPRAAIENLLVDTSLVIPDGDETRAELVNRLALTFQNLLKRFDLTKNNQSSYRMLVVEKNGATAIKTKNGPLGKKKIWTPPQREYFPDMSDDLYYQEPPFEGIERNSYYSTAIGCVGGPGMEVMIRIRELLNTLELEEAIPIYTSLGLRKLEAEEKALAGYGGSMAQIAAAREQIWPQLLHMPTDINNVDDIISVLPNFILDMISLRNPPPMAFPANTWEHPLGKRLAWQALDYSKLFIPADNDEQTYHAEYIFWASCFRLAESSILKNNLLDGADNGTVIINDPPFQLSESSRGILYRRRRPLF